MNPESDDERLGLPSASSAYARRRCLGRQTLIDALRAASKLPTRVASVEALSGIRIHAAWTGAQCDRDDIGSFSEHEPFGQKAEAILSDTEKGTLAGLRRSQTLIVSDWARGAPYQFLGAEVRLWLR